MTRNAFDWSRVHALLDSARARVERAASPDPAEIRRVLKARAAALAVAPAVERSVESLDVVEFLLAQETWAVESSFVREICSLTGLTPLPCTPSWVLGIATIRGEILSVIDIGRLFDLPARGLTELNKILVLGSGGMTFGILADSIVGLGSIPLEQIQSSLPSGKGMRESCIRGVTPDRKVILDAAKLTASEEILVREYVHAAVGERPQRYEKESQT